MARQPSMQQKRPILVLVDPETRERVKIRASIEGLSMQGFVYQLLQRETADLETHLRERLKGT